MKLLTPNRYSQAIKEIPQGLNEDVLEALKKIKESEKNHYFCLGIKSKKTENGMGLIYSASPQFAHIAAWEKMQKQIKKTQYKGLFGDKFEMVIIFHDPTIKPVKKKEKKAEATPEITPETQA